MKALQGYLSIDVMKGYLSTETFDAFQILRYFSSIGFIEVRMCEQIMPFGFRSLHHCGVSVNWPLAAAALQIEEST